LIGREDPVRIAAPCNGKPRRHRLRCAILQGVESTVLIRLRSDTRGNIWGIYRLESDACDAVPTCLSGGFGLDQTDIASLAASVSVDIRAIIDR
jgi:hypothetical protein